MRSRSRWAIAGLSAAALVVALSACGPDDSTVPVGASATATAPAGPQLIDCVTHKPVVRPDRIAFACADMGLTVDGITWTSWGPDKAEGDGTEHRNLCEPNCAAGKYVTEPAHVVLTQVNQDGLFTRGSATGSDGKPAEFPMMTR
ncbi:hypothetical protein [Nocardia stercoris]|uniref:hypothetical protein n=1 Tax=Nocardia stercoris TaxID=2483361 RepID=UPI0011C42933|nr:hypothetical protein [Nocardia stercoris]